MLALLLLLVCLELFLSLLPSCATMNYSVFSQEGVYNRVDNAVIITGLESYRVNPWLVEWKGMELLERLVLLDLKDELQNQHIPLLVTRRDLYYLP